MNIIGEELRLWRNERGLSQEELADRINLSRSMLSKVESGDRPLQPEYAGRCDLVLETGGLLARLLSYELRRDSTPEWVRPWLDLELRASSLRTYEPTFVPGLLQTEDYARALLRDEARVATRIERQRILDGLDGYTAVLDELVLTRPIGGAQVMAGQLARLLDEERAAIHIVPSGTGYYSGLNGAFTIAVVDGMEVAVLDAQLQGRVIELPEHLAAIRQVWESVRSEALPRGQSRELIREACDRWKS